ncbi:MAG: MFS transporter [Chloroflexi bacterium]|nr:MFS transporter [Chloroflexota bacterium]
MTRSRPFLSLMLADFIARSAYQMGKTPLLPIFAASLGASGAWLGMIVSISTITGLFLKPLFGILSDSWGRRMWLFVGAGFFVFVPFLYRFISTPDQLLLLRLLHGTATAIYGPVTLAYIAELARGGSLAAGIGTFEMARSGGYIVGPLLGGWLLLSLAAVDVFTVIGLLSCAMFLPLLWLPPTRKVSVLPGETSCAQAKKAEGPPSKKGLGGAWTMPALNLRAALTEAARLPAVWVTGGLEAAAFVALYTLKAFLPIFALEAGVSVALVGLFFSLSEAVHVLGKPVCGRLADKLGYLRAISLGMLLLALSLPLARSLDSGALFLLPAGLLGLAQALVFPAAKALIADDISADNLGAGMGLLGALQNVGKVAGPVLGGFAIGALGYSGALLALSGMLIAGTLALWLWSRRRK